MNKLIVVLIALVTGALGFFIGGLVTEETIEERQRIEQALLQAERLSQLIQYHTLVDVDKTAELKVVLNSKILEHKVRLETLRDQPDLRDNPTVRQSLSAANELLEAELNKLKNQSTN